LFNRSSDARNVAMVKQAQTNQGLSLSLASQLSPANRLYLNSVIAALPAASSVDLLISRGEQITLEGQKLLVSLLPFSHSGGDQPYLLIVQDISASITQKEQYETLVVATAAALFLIFALLLHLFLNQYRVRLIGVSERLPMLAEHKFKEYYTAASKKNKVPLFRLTDELDVVEDAANHLAKQLEDFDGQMAINTAKLEKMAMFDVLTGLPNRNMLTFQIEKQLAHSARDDRLVALMFMDLDDFKKVNDSHGHNVGDKLLKAAAMRISKPIRETDIASRFGGDEFVVLLSDIESKTQVELVAQKLVDEFVQPFDIDGYQFYISISIGVAITQHARATPVDLLRHADIAMYEAKAKKGAGFRIYDATMNLKVMEKVELEAEARVALRENQFSLSLQPQIDMSSNQLIGFEALLRWYHPIKGFISPAEFIPHLENTSFMLELDYWVISKSAQLARELSINGYPQCKIAINLSAAQFLDPNLPEFLSQQIKDNNLSPSQLCLELTETVLVSDIIRATSIMKTIQGMGCMIAIDDFGTGYSSLSYLKSLPADFIKIDRSFVGNIVHSADDKNIVYSTITMVSNMGLTVIAEGIETIEQYDLLKHFECHIAQGYLISRPIPETDLWTTLNDKVKNGLWDCAEQRFDT
jgi:diguanylate cyclase (GGDEF)-like protein